MVLNIHITKFRGVQTPSIEKLENGSLCAVVIKNSNQSFVFKRWAHFNSKTFIWSNKMVMAYMLNGMISNDIKHSQIEVEK